MQYIAISHTTAPEDNDLVPPSILNKPSNYDEAMKTILQEIENVEFYNTNKTYFCEFSDDIELPNDIDQFNMNLENIKKVFETSKPFWIEINHSSMEYNDYSNVYSICPIDI